VTVVHGSTDGETKPAPAVEEVHTVNATTGMSQSIINIFPFAVAFKEVNTVNGTTGISQ
jgi:hypothetical protein